MSRGGRPDDPRRAMRRSAPRSMKLPREREPRAAIVLSIVADLEGRDLDGLRRQWRAHLGGEAPAHLPRWLIVRVLAYRLQSDAFGDLDKSIRRNLRCERDDGAGVPFDRRAPQTRQGVTLKAGALLVREWRGRLERVMILEEGFAWNGQTFGSLSQIAKAMTGTKQRSAKIARRRTLRRRRLAKRRRIGPSAPRAREIVGRRDGEARKRAAPARLWSRRRHRRQSAKRLRHRSRAFPASTWTSCSWQVVRPGKWFTRQ